ncbi:MAG: hypothetical protein V6Z89_11650 [Desulfobacter sp.]
MLDNIRAVDKIIKVNDAPLLSDALSLRAGRPETLTPALYGTVVLLAL